MELRRIGSLMIAQTKKIVQILVHRIRWAEENRRGNERITLRTTSFNPWPRWKGDFVTRKRLSVGGARPGESVRGRRVNSSAKLLVSISSLIFGLIGAGIRFWAMASQSKSDPKNGCRLTSSRPFAPRRRFGFFVRSFKMKSLAIFEMWFGINGWFLMIRLSGGKMKVGVKSEDKLLGDFRLGVFVPVDGEGRGTSQQFEGQDTETPPIDRLSTTCSWRELPMNTYEIVSRIATFDHFGGHVFDRSTEGIRAFILNTLSLSDLFLLWDPYRIIRSKLFAQPKIRQNDVSVAIEKNILQLDISIDDAQLEEEEKTRFVGVVTPFSACTLCSWPRAKANSAM